jgi:UDP-N-acetylmuramoyl-L-alanyl-D-glutamate--2,6-diaminopimelate ligase
LNEYIEFRDKLPGAFNSNNVLAAILAVSGLLKMPVREIAPFVKKLKPVKGRMTTIEKGQPFELVIDYAHTPSSFQTVFRPLRERLNKSGGRIISLFGSGGERDTQKRPQQGKVAAEYCDYVILTDEDPRGEVPMAILEEIAGGIDGLNRDETLFLIPDRPAAIRKAFSLANKGDLVILLGKGHENSIIYKDHVMPYDEIAEAEKALSEINYR